MEKVIAVIAYAIIFCSLLINPGTDAMKLPQAHDQSDLENEYKLFRKPSVRTIKTEDRVIYDCVDFYKQHVFDHPLLKNHSFHPEMRPSSILKWVKASTSSRKDKMLLDSVKLKDGGCPKGTVPVRRISKHDYIEIKHFTEQFSRTKANDVQAQPGVNYAVVQTKSNPGTVLYNGVGADFSVHGVDVGPSQYSSGEMILRNGNDMIRFGWMVNPTLYKDNLTHLFQYLDAGESHCFNTLCPGFVSVRQDLPIDRVLKPLSIYGKETYGNSIFVYQDSASGIWWFQLHDTVLGWWPRVIFTGLAHSATYVAVGGQTFTPDGQSIPPMGTGHYPRYNWDTTKIAHFRNWIIVDTNEKQVEPDDTEEYTTDDRYGAKYKGHLYKSAGRLVFYGGSA